MATAAHFGALIQAWVRLRHVLAQGIGIFVLSSTSSLMPTKIVRVQMSSSEVRLQAANLISAWEHARPSGSPPITPEFKAAYDQFVEEALTDNQETNLEVADLREALNGACGIAIGRAEASGPGRALRALSEAYQNRQVVENRTAAPGKVLLAIQSQSDAELQMDELTDITETLQGHLGCDWEMVFGHGIVPELPAELRIMFVLAPH